MKNNLLVLLICFLGCSAHQDMNIPIEIEDINKSYKLDDKIEYTIWNNSSDTVYYYVGVERFVENRWREIILDINFPLSKSAKISKLINRHKNYVSYKFTNTPNGFFDRFNMFRFVISYGYSVNTIDKITYSQEFEIQNNSNN